MFELLKYNLDCAVRNIQQEIESFSENSSVYRRGSESVNNFHSNMLFEHL